MAKKFDQLIREGKRDFSITIKNTEQNPVYIHKDGPKFDIVKVYSFEAFYDLPEK